MLSTEAGLIANVLANPKDATARLVYADFLHEQGEHRAEEEKTVREEAGVVASGGTAVTLDEIKLLPNTDDVRGRAGVAWASWHANMILRAIAAEVGDRAKVELRGAAIEWRTTGTIRVMVDGLQVIVEVSDGLSGRWSHESDKRAWCQVRVGYTNRRTFPIGKQGFSVGKVVAAALEEVAREKATRDADESLRARHEAANTTANNLCAEFKVGSALERSDRNHDHLRLALHRSPEEMRRLLQCLKDNGFLSAEGGAK